MYMIIKLQNEMKVIKKKMSRRLASKQSSGWVNSRLFKCKYAWLYISCIFTCAELPLFLIWKLSCLLNVSVNESVTFCQKCQFDTHLSDERIRGNFTRFRTRFDRDSKWKKYKIYIDWFPKISSKWDEFDQKTRRKLGEISSKFRWKLTAMQSSRRRVVCVILDLCSSLCSCVSWASEMSSSTAKSTASTYEISVNFLRNFLVIFFELSLNFQKDTDLFVNPFLWKSEGEMNYSFFHGVSKLWRHQTTTLSTTTENTKKLNDYIFLDFFDKFF